MVFISWVTDQIGVSGAFSSSSIPFLQDEDVAAVVDLRSEYSDDRELIEKHGIKFLHVDVEDCYCPEFAQLETILGFVEPFLDSGKKVLIHCQNGYGRSPLVVVAVLVKRGMSIPQAVSLVEDKHPWTAFTPKQEKFVYVELDKFFNPGKY